MAGRRKFGDDKDNGFVAEAASPDVRVGDVVIYNHRPMTTLVETPAMFPVPMIVTTVHASGDVNGVVASDNTHLGFIGTKVIYDAPKGNGPGEWQLRT